MINFFGTLHSKIIAVQTTKELSTKNKSKLIWLFSCSELVSEDTNKPLASIDAFFIGPRAAMVTPWSTNAVEITENMGISGIIRIEEFITVDEEFTDFRNIGDVVYPLLYLEWIGGIKNTKFANMNWLDTSEMGFERLKFKIEPVDYDYLYDESENFGEHGYACWDIRVLIDKDGDLGLPVNMEVIYNLDEVKPFIQELFPESARNKLTSFRNYSEEQLEVIEMMWEFYSETIEFTSTFCKVEVVLV